MGSPVSPMQGAAEQDFAPRRFASGSSGSEARPESSVANGDGNAGGHPWCKNRPINGDTGYVMGTFSWPPLSESTRPVVRSSSDSPRPAPEGPVSSSQVKTEAPLISQPPQRQANAHSHSSSSTNSSSRPRSKARGGGPSGSGPPHNTFQRPSPPAPPVFPSFDMSLRPSPSMLDAPRPGIGSSPRNNTSRRGNYGPRPRGDSAPHQNNYGGVRRHHERRDVSMQPPYMPLLPMGYVPPPHLMTQAPVGFFPGPLGFDMTPFMYAPPVLPPEPFRTMPIVPPPPPPFFPPAYENTLTDKIIKQTNYYFSDDSLARDNFLRSMMDDQGWVPIRLIASFNLNFVTGKFCYGEKTRFVDRGLGLTVSYVARVEDLTKDIQVIMDALRHSTFLELQGEKIRCVTWKKWVRSSQPNTSATPAPPPPADDSKNNTIDRKDVQD